MKKITIVFFALLSLNSWGQQDKKLWLQKIKYDLGMSYYDKKDFDKAIEPFLFAYKINPESEVGKNSKIQIDTLIPVLRKNLIAKLSGTWQKEGNHPAWVDKGDTKNNEQDTLMFIGNDTIYNFKHNKKTKKTEFLTKEEIMFYNGYDNNFSVTELLDSNKEFWIYIVDKSLKNLRIINTAKTTKSGRTTIEQDNKEFYFKRIK